MGLEMLQNINSKAFTGAFVSNQRNTPRHDICTNIEYVMLNMDLPEQGTLYNLSQTGALIGIHRKVTLGTRLLFKVMPDEPTERPIGVIATIIREVPSTDSDNGNSAKMTYGCQIDRINGLN